MVQNINIVKTVQSMCNSVTRIEKKKLLEWSSWHSGYLSTLFQSTAIKISEDNADWSLERADLFNSLAV